MSACTNRIANPYDCTEEEAREVARNFDPNNQLEIYWLCYWHGIFETPIVGENEDGETVMVEPTRNFVRVTTYQDNGWIRVSDYGKDGYVTDTYTRD